VALGHRGVGPERIQATVEMSAATETITLGIIGCGWVTSTVHIPVLRQVDGVRISAACDVRRDRLQLMHRTFGIPRLHEDWRAVLAEPDLDAVLIATPADSHAPLAAAAIAAGKHVFVEKPFALTVTDAESLAEQARHATVVCMVGHHLRFHPLAQGLKEAIERARLGRPLATVVTMLSSPGQKVSVSGYEVSPRRGGGVFHDSVVHIVDLLRFLFDCEVLDGTATARSEFHEHDSATIALGLANGVSVIGYLSNRAIADMTCLVIGDEGKAAVNFARPTGVALYRREFSRSRLAKLWGFLRQTPRIGSAVRFATPAGRLAAYRNQWRHFFACIRSSAPPTPSFEDGLAVTRTVADLIASLETPRDGRSDVSPKNFEGEPGGGAT